ncbi:Cell division protein FtsQ [Ferriphaselus amnicola]|uniref:Cell division protein FtsQ n=1 Tax=Ferriphaselus amnicola TaxID=1188319 RepID=A0A2Z6G8K4_9PROT|nr:cell division protein FtsQ/DivIB [Ferriphaselus amnicola]BBE49806.1 Cell division protein FtsQ [Ferriphaselus amnicola]
MWDDAKALRNLANALFGISLLLILAGAAHYVVHLPIFPLKSAKLTAMPQRVSVEQVERVVRNELKGNFFTADLVHLRKSLEQLPWVRKVSLRREFPWQVEIALEEHQAVARWNGIELVNNHGEVFSAGTEDELPEYYGPTGTSAEVMQKFADFGAQLKPLEQSIAQISLSPRRDWRIKLDNGLVLELGREETGRRLSRFVAVYHYSLASSAQKVSYVDLRYRSGFAAYLPGGLGKTTAKAANSKV